MIMNFTINTESVVNRLERMAAVIPNKIILPATGDVKVEVFVDSMMLTVNNGNTQVSSTIPCESKETFSFCVPYNLFYKTMKFINAISVKVSHKPNVKAPTIEIKAEGKKYVIGCTDANGFIKFDKPNKDSYIVSDSQIIKEAISTAGRFVNIKEPREPLRGVSMIFMDGKVVITAADSFSMCRLIFEADMQDNWNDVIVPYDLSIIIVKLLISSEQASINTDSKRIHIETKDFDVISTLMEHRYPEVEWLFKDIETTPVTVSRIDVNSSINLLKEYTGETGNTLIFDVNSERVELSAENKEMNHFGVNDITLSSPSQVPSVRTGFNIEQFSRILSSITTDKICLQVINDRMKPLYVTPCFETEPVIESKFLLMPISI